MARIAKQVSDCKKGNAVQLRPSQTPAASRTEFQVALYGGTTLESSAKAIRQGRLERTLRSAPAVEQRISTLSKRKAKVQPKVGLYTYRSAFSVFSGSCVDGI